VAERQGQKYSQDKRLENNGGRKTNNKMKNEKKMNRQNFIRRHSVVFLIFNP
jgi:hypothetical protein